MVVLLVAEVGVDLGSLYLYMGAPVQFYIVGTNIDTAVREHITLA